MTRALALACVALAACGSDPCDGQPRACVSVTVSSQVDGVDQLAFFVDQPRHEQLAYPDQATGALIFPLRMALIFPDGTAGVDLALQGFIGGRQVAFAAGSVAFSDGHGSASLALAPLGPGGDGGSGDDLGPSLFRRALTLTGVGVPVALAAADFNADGKIDLAFANGAAAAGGQAAGVAINAGGGALMVKTALVEPASPTSIMAVDVNSDSRVDVIVTSSSAGALYLGNNDGTFGGVSNLTVSGAGAAIAADVDGDLRPDLVYAVAAPPSVQVLTSLRTPPGVGAGGYSVVGAPGHLAAADLTGDGRVDLIVVTAAPSIYMLTHASPGALGSFYGAGTGYALPAAGAGVTIADVDRDGHPDVLVSTTAGLMVFGGNAPGTLQPPVSSGVGVPPSENIAVADFDGDGKLDVALADHAGNKVYVLLNAGARVFVPWQTLVVDRNPAAIVAADFDGDGKPDLATANQGDGTITVLLNRSH